MALINGNSLKRIEKERNSVHKDVESTYTSFSDGNGNKYFQIDTYGSAEREIRGKVSQTIQLDKCSADALVRILKSEFNL